MAQAWSASNILSCSSRSTVKGNLILYLAYLPADVDPVVWTPGPADDGITAGVVIDYPCESLISLDWFFQAITDSEISIQSEETSVVEVLANGWEERVDQNGRIYYVDHKSKRTQWEKPTKFVINFLTLIEGWIIGCC